MIAARIFLWFLIYSFIGWAYESILCSITGKKLVNRGFLNGPVCPVYGCGALIIIFSLQSVTDNILVLFLSSVVLTTTLEYITSYLLETFFHAKWWDYSRYHFQINGRVCLLGSLVFGLLSVLLMLFIHPFVKEMVEQIPDKVLLWTAVFLLLLFLSDIFVTVRHILLLNGRLQEIQEAINQYAQNSRERAQQLKSTLLERFENSEFNSLRIKALLDMRKFQDRRLMKAFPRLESVKYKEALEKIKSRLEAPFKDDKK